MNVSLDADGAGGRLAVVVFFLATYNSANVKLKANITHVSEQIHAFVVLIRSTIKCNSVSFLSPYLQW